MLSYHAIHDVQIRAVRPAGHEVLYELPVLGNRSLSRDNTSQLPLVLSYLIAVRIVSL